LLPKFVEAKDRADMGHMPTSGNQCGCNLDPTQEGCLKGTGDLNRKCTVIPKAALKPVYKHPEGVLLPAWRNPQMQNLEAGVQGSTQRAHE
jgi:hypothetical protein